MKEILSKNFEDLTFIEKQVLALKGALEEYKVEEDEERKEFLGMFIGMTSAMLKEQGIYL